MAVLIRGGQVLGPTLAAVEPADVLVEGDRIAAVGARLSAPEQAREVDARGCLVLPGLVNAHTHAHNNLLKGSAERWTLEELLNHGTALNANRTVEDHYLSAALGAVEMLRTGCTAAYDLFTAVPAPTEEAVEAVVRAYMDVGLRAVIAPAVADLVFYHTVPGLLGLLPPELRKGVESLQAPATGTLLRLTENVLKRWDRSAGGRIRLAVAPTIPGQCSDEFLTGCVSLAREYGAGLHTHLAETKVQAVHAQERWGKTIVARLADVGALGPHFVGAHGVWLTDEDISRLADAGASVAHNPASNLRLGSGIAPVREMLDRGVNVALGTDGSMSSDNQNLFEAMRLAALVSTVRSRHDAERWLDARAAWTLATAGSARALRLGADLGALAPGRKADLVLVRHDSPFLRPLNHAVNALVYAETGADVDTVLADGRVVMERGRILTVDEARLRERAQAAADRVRCENRALWAMAAQISPYLTAACRAAVAVPFPVDRYAGAARA